jgi:hypothetical protein
MHSSMMGWTQVGISNKKQTRAHVGRLLLYEMKNNIIANIYTAFKRDITLKAPILGRIKDGNFTTRPHE